MCVVYAVSIGLYVCSVGCMYVSVCVLWPGLYVCQCVCVCVCSGIAGCMCVRVCVVYAVSIVLYV